MVFKNFLKKWFRRNTTDNINQDLIYPNYKEPLRMVADGYGYMGTLACTTDYLNIQCHICGNVYSNLGTHLKRHQITAREYRDKFGLSGSTPLTNYKLSEKRARRMKRYAKNHKNELIKKLPKSPGGVKKSLEQKNKEGRCPDQLLDKIMKLYNKLGRVPSSREFGRYCGYGFLYNIKKEFGTYAAAVYETGLTPRRSKYN